METLHTLLGSSDRECFLMLRWNLPRFILCPLPLTLLPGTTRYLHRLIRSSWSLLSFRVNSASSYQPSWHGRCSLPHLSDPSLDSPVSLACTEKPRTGRSAPDAASAVLDRGKGSPFQTCWQSLHNAGQDTVHLFSKCMSQTRFQLGAYCDLQLLLCQAAFQCHSSQHVLVQGIFPSQLQDSALLFKLHQVPVSPFTQPAYVHTCEVLNLILPFP